ncbi:MAG: TrmH family RNA methyltransferase [Acidimicrobiales bacterium]
MRVEEISDPADPRVADYLHLTDAELRRAFEGRAGVFIVEGGLCIAQLARSGYRARSALVTPARLAALEGDLALLGAPVYVAAQAVMNEVAGFSIHRGAVAAAERPPPPLLDEVLAAASTVAVLEALTDTENVGALFRNAAAFGVDAVLLSPRCADPLYRRAVRVSMGHVLRVPFATLPAWPEAAAALRARGFTLAALTPEPTAAPLGAAADSLRGRRSALLLGAEGVGLSPDALHHADLRVRIPMVEGVDSLNVATAAAVAFYELARVR